jgi:hypothetical protein
MAESKIEKPQSGSDFELRCKDVVKMIEDENTAFNVIPDIVKDKFLNFDKLPLNEQLELISDLSTIKGLPQEMTDTMNQFPFLQTVSEDNLQDIGSYLKKKEPKEDKDISAFVATHKRPHALFQPDRLGNLLFLLLLNVPRGKQDEAEKIVDMHPELQLECGTVTDYSGRTFKDITAYEYAYWAKDTHMCRMLEKHMSAQTKAKMHERCEAIEKNGLTYTQHGVEVKGAMHFDFMPLKQALQNYIDGYDNWFDTDNWTALKAAWLQVGIAQRDVPAHVANEYCRKDRLFDPLFQFNEDKLPRELTFYNYTTRKDEQWFPMVVSDSSGLGVDFALIRANLHEHGGLGAIGLGGRVRHVASGDLETIDLLDKVRTTDLTQSRENLRSANASLNRGFHFS